MATKPFGELPDGMRQQPEPFELHINEQKLQDMKTLIRLSPVAKDCYENQKWESGFGVTREWMLNAKKVWAEDFDWRAKEFHINTFPNFRHTITDPASKHTFTIHFTALFSANPRAVPLALFHGWPGSFLEFLPILSLLKTKYTPETLPYHVIVPSLPGYTLSSTPPLDRNWGIADTARIMHNLLLSLDFDAYAVQGGDIGSYVSRYMGAKFAECRAIHLNFSPMPPPSSPSPLETTQLEKEGLERGEIFKANGRAYALMHGTRPATIGHVLSASPLAILAWIGEKFLAWSDPNAPIPLPTILEDVSLYWLTDCFPTSIYTYHEQFEVSEVKGWWHGREEHRIPEGKGLGYSYFKYEIGGPSPRSWVGTTGELVYHKAHERGGHFAALERSEELLQDVEAFLEVAWKGRE